MVSVPPHLDFASDLFDPVKALSSKSFRLPYAKSKTYNNLSEYYVYTFGNKRSRENEISMRKQNKNEYILERNYSWYYATLGLEYSENDEMEDHFAQDTRLKESALVQPKRKLTSRLGNSSKREKYDCIAPLQSSKVIISKATNSGLCKKYLCYAVKNVRKRLYLRQTIDSYYENQAAKNNQDFTQNSPHGKNVAEELSGRSVTSDKSEHFTENETLIPAQDTENKFCLKAGTVINSQTNNNEEMPAQNPEQFHIKSLNLTPPKGGSKSPLEILMSKEMVECQVKTIGNKTNASTHSSDIEFSHKSGAAKIFQMNSLSTINNKFQNQPSEQFGIKSADLAKDGTEEPVEILNLKENAFHCAVKTENVITQTASKSELSYNVNNASNSFRNLPSINNDKNIQNLSPVSCHVEMNSAISDKLTKNFKTGENVGSYFDKKPNKGKLNVVMQNSSSPKSISIMKHVKSKNEVESNFKSSPIDKILSVKDQVPHLFNTKSIKDLDLFKSKVKSNVSQETNLVAKENLSQATMKKAGTDSLHNYGAVVPDSTKLRGYKIPRKRKILSEIGN